MSFQFSGLPTGPYEEITVPSSLIADLYLLKDAVWGAGDLGAVINHTIHLQHFMYDMFGLDGTVLYGLCVDRITQPVVHVYHEMKLTPGEGCAEFLTFTPAEATDLCGLLTDQDGSLSQKLRLWTFIEDVFPKIDSRHTWSFQVHGRRVHLMRPADDDDGDDDAPEEPGGPDSGLSLPIYEQEPVLTSEPTATPGIE